MKAVVHAIAKALICAIIGAVIGFCLPGLYYQVFAPHALDDIGGLGGLGLMALFIASAECGFILGFAVSITITVRKAKRVVKKNKRIQRKLINVLWTKPLGLSGGEVGGEGIAAVSQ